MLLVLTTVSSYQSHEEVKLKNLERELIEDLQSLGENVVLQNLDAQEDLPDTWNVHMQDGTILQLIPGVEYPDFENMYDGGWCMGFACPAVEYVQYGASPVPQEHYLEVNGELTFYTPLDNFIGTSWKFYPKGTALLLFEEREEESTLDFECTEIMPGYDSCMWIHILPITDDTQEDLPDTWNAHL